LCRFYGHQPVSKRGGAAEQSISFNRLWATFNRLGSRQGGRGRVLARKLDRLDLFFFGRLLPTGTPLLAAPINTSPFLVFKISAVAQ
jgi:hypothetical protein